MRWFRERWRNDPAGVLLVAMLIGLVVGTIVVAIVFPMDEDTECFFAGKVLICQDEDE